MPGSVLHTAYAFMELTFQWEEIHTQNRGITQGQATSAKEKNSTGQEKWATLHEITHCNCKENGLGTPHRGDCGLDI